MGQNMEIRKVLIVDDEPDLRDLLADMMQSLNIECDLAENGKVALSLLRQNDYHAVLCDIMMPEMTGLECLAQAQAENIMTPFVFITGYSDNVRMLQAIRLGAVDFISKPFSNAEVTEVLFRVLEIGVRRRRIHREIKNTDPELFANVQKDEKLIALMRARNNKIRT